LRKLLTSLLAIALLVAPVFAASVVLPVNAQSDWDWDYSSSSTDDGVAGMSLIIWCCCFAVMLIVPIALAFFVYSDAQKNNVDNPILWALIVFIFGLLGLLIYLLVGKKKE